MISPFGSKFHIEVKVTDCSHVHYAFRLAEWLSFLHARDLFLCSRCRRKWTNGCRQHRFESGVCHSSTLRRQLSLVSRPICLWCQSRIFRSRSRAAVRMRCAQRLLLRESQCRRCFLVYIVLRVSRLHQISWRGDERHCHIQ